MLRHRADRHNLERPSQRRMVVATCALFGACGRTELFPTGAPSQAPTGGTAGGGATGAGGQGGRAPFGCAAGTWDHDADGTTPCVPWTDCPAGRRVLSSGSATKDRLCASCPDGQTTTMVNATDCVLVCSHGGAPVTLKSGRVVCDCPAGTWGDACEKTTRQDLAPSEPFARVAAGYSHTCGLRADGTVSCWGQLDSGRPASAPSGIFTDIAAAGSHTCGLRTNARIECWGGSELIRPPQD